MRDADFFPTSALLLSRESRFTSLLLPSGRTLRAASGWLSRSARLSRLEFEKNSVSHKIHSVGRTTLATDSKSLFDVAVAPPSGLPCGSLSALRSGSTYPISAVTKGSYCRCPSSAPPLPWRLLARVGGDQSMIEIDQIKFLTLSRTCIILV
jgi:hypothetical protein